MVTPKTIIIALCLTMMNITVCLADSGTIIKEDACGSDNYIAETSDGWFIAFEFYGGDFLNVGDKIYGDMKTYGFQTLHQPDGSETDVYIEDYETNLQSAFEELCK